MRTLALLAAATCACATASAGGAPGAKALADAALRARERAVAELATSRARIVQQRRELFERVAKLQAQLERERAAALKAAEELDAARRGLAGRTAEMKRERAEYRRLLEQVGESCDLDAPLPDDDVAAVGAAVRGALTARLTRIRHGCRVHVRSQTVADRTGRTLAVPVIALGSVQELAAGRERATCGFLRRDGTTAYVSGPEFDASHLDELRAAADGKRGALPCDVSGTLVEQQLGEAWSLGGWLAAGGVFMAPIVLALLFAAGLATERIVALTRLQVDPEAAGRVLGEVRDGKLQAAMETVADGTTPLDRVLHAGLQSFGLDRQSREAALEAALLQEHPNFEKSLTLLAALAAIAPLLGLLGTVTGMIGTFETIAVNGTGDPRLLSGGISEALITTQAGLLTAVPILLLHAYLGRVVDNRQAVLEQTAASLLTVSEEQVTGVGVEVGARRGKGKGKKA